LHLEKRIMKFPKIPKRKKKKEDNRPRWKKILGKIGWGLLITLVVANLAVILTGNFYIYNAILKTYMVGQTGPGIDDYQYFYNNEVKTGETDPWAKHASYKAVKMPKLHREKLEEYETTAFLIIKNDSLYYEKYWSDYNKNSITNSFSMAKSIVSILIGIAIDEGHIESVDQKIGDFLPYFRKGKKSKLTIRHMLTMCSGLNWTESTANPFSDNAEAYYGWDLKGQIKELEVIEKPGKKFKYLSGNTQVLGFVLEKAVGKSISEYASEKLWQKVGAETTALWSLDDEDGDEKTFCCYYATARDYARIGQLFLNGGMWNGERIISENYIKEATVPAPLKEESGKPNKRYGYSYWIVKYKGMDLYFALGARGQFVISFPDLNMVVVRIGHSTGEKLSNGHHADLYNYIDAALEMTNFKAP
jgi:CubicO group peptidase (beta-lactamase class C family)